MYAGDQGVFPNSKLKLIGSDFDVNETAYKWCIKQNIKINNIIFAGIKNRKELINEIDKSTIMIHPSLEESFGNVLVEAMCRKTPVIGGKNSGAVPWVLNYGKAGVLVDITKPDKIAGASINILRNEEKLKNIGESGYIHAKNNYSMSIIAKQHIKIYKKIVEDK